MTQRESISRLAHIGNVVAVPIIPMVMVLGLLLGIAALVGIAVSGEVAGYWPFVGGAWLVLLFGLAIASSVTAYWIPRVVIRDREFLPKLFTVFYSGMIPALAWVIAIVEHDVPAWLSVLGMIPIVLGLGTFLDAGLIRPTVAKHKRAGGDRAR